MGWGSREDCPHRVGPVGREEAAPRGSSGAPKLNGDFHVTPVKTQPDTNHVVGSPGRSPSF